MSAYVNPEASNGVAVGSWAKADALNSVALGTGAQATHRYSVALGQQSGTTRENEVYIGYDSGVTNPASPRVPDKTRVLGGVSDGTRDTDAATVGQLNRKADEVYSDVSGRIAAEALKARDHTDTVAAENRENIIRNTVAINRNTRGLLSQRDVLETHEERLNSQQQQINTGSTVAVDSHGYVTRGEGTGERITVQEGLVRTQEMATENRAAVSRNRQVGERNSRAIAFQARTLQAHERRMNSQQRWPVFSSHTVWVNLTPQRLWAGTVTGRLLRWAWDIALTSRLRQRQVLRSVTVMFPGMWVSTGSSEPGSESPGRAAFCMRS